MQRINKTSQRFNQKRKNRYFFRFWTNCTIFFVFFFCSLNSFAFSFQSKQLQGNLDTTISAGALFRIQSPSSTLIDKHNGGTAQNAINTDDGNRYFEKGLLSAAIKFTHDFEVNYRNFGSLIRASYFYDPVMDKKTHLTSEAKKHVAKDFDLLDAYVFGHFAPLNKDLEVRVGNQVINWGENTFIRNGINVINPIDASRLRIPGAKIKEALIPTPIIWASQNLSENISVEGFYILKFNHAEIDPLGSYFSSNDVMGDGADHLIAGFGLADETGTIPTISPTGVFVISRIADVDAANSGEAGAAFRLFIPELNDTEVAAYVMNYHSRLPIGSLIAGNSIPQPQPSTAKFYVEYPENIHMAGFSFNTLLPFSGIALQGEYSYRPNMPLQIEFTELVMAATHLKTPTNEIASQLGSFNQGDIIQGYKRYKVGQAQLSATKTFSRNNLFKADSWVFFSEAAMTQVYNLPNKSTLRFEAAGTNLPARDDIEINTIPIPKQKNGYADNFSWGYHLMTKANYNNVFMSVNLSPRIIFSHDVKGTTPGPGGNFIVDRKKITLGIEAEYLQTWTFDINLTKFFGAEGHNPFADRDYISTNIKYGF